MIVVVVPWPSGLVITSLKETSRGTGPAVETKEKTSSFTMRGVAVGLDVGELVGCG